MKEKSKSKESFAAENAVQPIVVQSNDFTRNASCDLDLAPSRLLYFLLSCVRKNDDDGICPVVMSYRSIGLVVGDDFIAHSRSQQLVRLIDNLASQKFWLLEESRMTAIPWFTRCVLDHEYGEGSVLFEFNPFVRKYLFDLNGNFTRYQYRYIKNLRSKYSVRLYNLLRGAAYKDGLNISFVNLRVSLFLLNVSLDLDRLPKYYMFVEKVLAPAVSDINEHSDISVLFDAIKDPTDQRKTTGVCFSVSVKDTPAEALFSPPSIRYTKSKSADGGSPSLLCFVGI